MEGLVPNIEELITNLNRQVTLYRQMIDLVREEREHIVGLKFRELREDTYSKEAIIDEIQREDYRRVRWIASAAKVLGRDVKDITIEIIASEMARAHYETLMSVKNTLLVLIKKAKEMNHENKRLVEIALGDAQEMKKNILGITSDQPQTYGPKGSMGPMKDTSARMLNKEA